MQENKIAVRVAVAVLITFSLAPASQVLTNLFGSAGLWNNSAMNAALTGALNAATFVGAYHGGQLNTSFADAAVVGVTSDTVGSTDIDTMGVFGGATCNNTVTNCEGGTFYGIAGADGTGSALANRVRIWGINPLASDFGHNHVLLQNEFDTNVTGPDTLAFGISIVGASTHALAAGSTAISVGAPGSGLNWPFGLIIGDGAVGGNDAIRLGLQASGNSQPSQLMRMVTTDSGGTVHTAGLLGFASGGMLLATDSEATNTAAQFLFNTGGSTKATINHDGSLSQTGVTFANLPTTNGTIVYCTNCVINAVCAAGGQGAFAKRLNGASVCN